MEVPRVNCLSVTSADPAGRRVYLECSETASNLLRTGIQRVVRNVILHHDAAGREVGVAASPARFFGDSFYPFDWRPQNDSAQAGWGKSLHQRMSSYFGEYVADRWVNRYNLVAARARKAVRFRKLRRLMHSIWLKRFGQPLSPRPGDLMVLVDATWNLPIWPAVQRWRRQGGQVGFVIYDILAITNPEFFKPSLSPRFTKWFGDVWSNSDLLLAISDTVRDQLRGLPNVRPDVVRGPGPRIESFPLGAELDMQHADAYVRAPVRAALAGKPPPYLMVGTIEPRKNHGTVLDAFEKLWSRGQDVRLFVVGRHGWECQQLERRLLTHPQLGQNLYWFPDMTDSELHHCYQNARAVIFASWGEGYGLPIVEGLQYGLPVIASDLAVHREVAGPYAVYFDPSRAGELTDWIDVLETRGDLPTVAPRSEFRPVTWPASVRRMLQVCRGPQPEPLRAVPSTVAPPQFLAQRRKSELA